MLYSLHDWGHTSTSKVGVLFALSIGISCLLVGLGIFSVEISITCMVYELNVNYAYWPPGITRHPLRTAGDTRGIRYDQG